MTTYSRSGSKKLKINRLTKTQFNNAPSLNSGELYFVDPEFTGNKVLVTDANGDITESSINPSNVVTDVKANNVSFVTNGVADIPLANFSDSAAVYGLIRLYNYDYGLSLNPSTGGLYVLGAANTQITGKTSTSRPLLPKNIDLAVKVGVTTNTETLSSTEKHDACGWLGALNEAETLISGSSDPTSATVGTLGLIYKNTTNGKLFSCTVVDSVTPSYTWTEIGAGGGGGGIISSGTYTLSAASWNNDKTYNLSISAVTASSTIIVSAAYSADGSNELAYADANIRGASQSSGVLTFACATIPLVDIDVNVVVA